MTDMSQVPWHVRDKIGEAGLNLLEICAGCYKFFSGTKCLCAICAKPVSQKEDDPKRRPIPDTFTNFHLRKFAAQSDVVHDKCIKAAQRRFEAQGKHVRPRTEEAKHELLVCEVDTERDKNQPLSKEEKLMLGFLLSCQRHRGETTFTVPVPRQGSRGGSGISATITPVVRGQSQRSKERHRKVLTDTAKHMASNPNADITATDIVVDTALHSRVGMKGKLVGPENQTPIDAEAMQADIKGSFRKLKLVMRHCRKAGNKFKHNLKILQERRLARRLPMVYEETKVYHPSFSQHQTLYMKRAVSLCGVVANRMALLFENDCFIELDGVTMGANGDIYLTFAVCVYDRKKNKKKEKIDSPHSHPPSPTLTLLFAFFYF